MPWLRLSTLLMTLFLGLALLLVARGDGPRSTGIYVWVMVPISEEEWQHNPAADDRTLVLQVFEHEYKLNSETYGRDDLLNVLATIYRTRTEKVLLVYGDPDISYQRMMDVLSDVRGRIPELHFVLFPVAGNAALQSWRPWRWRIHVPRPEVYDLNPRAPWSKGGPLEIR